VKHTVWTIDLGPSVNAEQNTTTPLSQDCLDKAEVSVHSQSAQLDAAKAESMAVNSGEFQDRVKGYTPIFNSIFHDWTVDRTNCAAIWNDVNVVYFLNDTNGYAKNLVITLDPGLTKIMKVDEYKSVKFTTFSFPNWDGYEFYAPTAPSNVYKAQAIYNHPTVQQPPSGQPLCTSKQCDLAIWTGLEDSNHASNNHLAQTGSVGNITCSSLNNCSAAKYQMWYEFLPANAVYCGGAMSAGDQISAKITNDGVTNGTTDHYDVFTADTTTSGLCSTTVKYTAMTVPTIAAYINERSCLSSCTGTPVYSSLAKFSSDTITGYIYYHSTLNSISVPWTASAFNEYNMTNSGTVNIGHTAKTSPGTTITETWKTSSNTG
jgi:hypothetical protein